jgi:hypothetical protein
MVTSLAKTLAMKNDAFSRLQSKSKSISKVLEPRKAYKYVPH